MNFNRHARRIEEFLEEEFRKKVPLIELPNKNLVYKNYIIKQNKQGNWCFTRKNTAPIDEFKIKTTAAIAAKLYDDKNFAQYNKIRRLDRQYWNNSIDAKIFKHKYENTVHIDKKELYFCRYNLAENRARQFKNEISRLFKLEF